MNLKDIGIFIDSGWSTIPYDSIKYENGKKIASPPIKWKEFVLTKNTKRSRAGAVICDKVLVVDCDSLEATKKFLDIAKIEGIESIEDLGKEGVEEKIGLVVKTTKGYHFYFNNTGEFGDLRDEKIDIQATNKRIVYLPSETSEGKEIIAINKVLSEDFKTYKIVLTDINHNIKEWFKSLSKEDNPIEAKKVRYTLGTPLAKIPLGSNLFFKRLTPKSYKEDSFYREIIDQQGYLHPNDIRDGDGNDYLISIAGILCSDPTIDINDFWKIMEFVNSLWDYPLSQEDLEKKVEAYPMNRYAGCPFVYDDKWEEMQYSFIDVDGNDIMMVYDLKTSKYIIANLSTDTILTKNSSDAVSFYANRTGEKIGNAKLASILIGVNVEFNPLAPFGLSEDKKFNIYKHSKYLEILNSDYAYAKHEIEDSKTCKALPFFKHLFKDSTEYFLRFLKTKFTTFKYSPTTFCLFDDEGGAGKGALEVFLGRFIGMDKITRIPYDTFQSKFTSDYEGKLIIFFNEFPEDFKIRKANTDKIKEITGSPTSKIEKKGCDPYEVVNYATHFITSNRISVEIREGDRRFCVVQCDKKFDDVFYSGYFDEMTSDSELSKLAIYLREFVQPLSHKEYMSPPMTIAKELFVDCNESDLDVMVRRLCEQDYDSIYEISKEFFIAESDLVNLTKMSEYLGVKTRVFTNALRKKIGQGKLRMEIFKDTNKKHDVSSCFTMGQLPSQSLEKYVKFYQKSTKSDKI